MGAPPWGVLRVTPTPDTVLWTKRGALGWAVGTEPGARLNPATLDASGRRWERPEEFYATQELVDQLLQPGVRREATKHTTSTNLVRRVDVKTLQKFLGHADMRSTDRYVVLGSGDVKDTIRG